MSGLGTDPFTGAPDLGQMPTSPSGILRKVRDGLLALSDSPGSGSDKEGEAA